MRQCQVIVVVILAMAIGAASPVQAQILKRLKDRAKDRIERNVGDKQDEAIDRAMNGEAAAQPAGTTTSESAPIDAGEATQPASASAAAIEEVGEGVWVNYDFVPGERVLYAEDFSSDRVGNFPRRLEFVEGNMEVAEWQGKRWLRGTSRGGFDIVLDETLPDRFTIEFDAFGISGSAPYLSVILDGVEDLARTTRDMVIFNPYESGVFAGNHSKRATSAANLDAPFRARVMGDGGYIKVYVNELRVANIPNADLGRSDRIRIAALGSTDRPFLLADLRVAAGGRELYETLQADGRVTTQGILFDMGSADVRPESTPTLIEISQVMKEHPDLRVAIEGHTDSMGSADANKTLSQKRAEAVRSILIEKFDVEASRLEAAGHGQERPVASNDTSEGRQMNRRVELVRL